MFAVIQSQENKPLLMEKNGPYLTFTKKNCKKSFTSIFGNKYILVSVLTK